MLVSVKCSLVNTCPRWPLQLAQVISVRWPSGSGVLVTDPGISLSKAGQPQWALNLSIERYNSALHFRHIYVPGSKQSSYSPENGGSVPFSSITNCSCLESEL